MSVKTFRREQGLLPPRWNHHTAPHRTPNTSRIFPWSFVALVLEHLGHSEQLNAQSSIMIVHNCGCRGVSDLVDFMINFCKLCVPQMQLRRLLVHTDISDGPSSSCSTMQHFLNCFLFWNIWSLKNVWDIIFGNGCMLRHYFKYFLGAYPPETDMRGMHILRKYDSHANVLAKFK